MAGSILIVDDEFGLAEAVSEALTHLGYSTATAINGRLGLAAVERARPDLILLDLMMPVLTGIEMLQLLKADVKARDIPVVIMSAAGPEAIPDGLQAHVQGFVQKPFTLEDLMNVLQPILGPAHRA